MKKRKNAIFIIAFVSVMLVLNLIFIYSRFWAKSGYAKMKEEDLEETFEGIFYRDPREYDDIVHAKNGNLIVYLGKKDGGGWGEYAIFRKVLFLNRWVGITHGSLEYGFKPTLIEIPSGRVYLSLNAMNIVKAEVVKDGESTMTEVDPDRPLVLIAEPEIEKVTFFSESGKEISEKEFLGKND